MNALPVEREIDLVITSRDHTHLAGAFVWDRTIEGREYWNARFEGREPIDDEVVAKLQRIKQDGR